MPSSDEVTYDDNYKLKTIINEYKEFAIMITVVGENDDVDDARFLCETSDYFIFIAQIGN